MGHLFIILLAISSLTSPTQGSPKHQWPLTAHTVLWDDQNDDNHGQLVYPTDGSSCPFLVAEGPVTFDGSSFYFDGDGLSVSNLPIPEGGKFDNFGFCVYLKPDQSQSSPVNLFQYQSTSSSGSYVTWVRVILLASGHVELTLGKEGSTYGNLTSTVPVTSSDFTRVAVSLEKSDSKLHVMVGHTHTSVELVDYYALKVPGMWRLGERFTADSARYKGLITCASFLDFHVDSSTSDSEVTCSDSYDPKDVPTCETSTIPPDTAIAATTTPETAAAETTPPETTAAETTPPETTAAETTPPETTAAETTPPETTSAETPSPETTAAETTPPETTAAETTTPETTSAETTLPETTAAQTTAAETTTPETTSAETTPPETTAAETTPPETTAAETTTPKTTSAEATTPPETVVAETTPSDVTAAETTTPETNAADTSPETIAAQTTTLAAVGAETTTPETTSEAERSTPETTDVAETTTPQLGTTTAATSTPDTSEAPQTSTSACPETTSTTVCPLHLWPLTDVTRGYDVMTGQAPLTSQGGTIACLGTRGGSTSLLPLLPAHPLRYDGSTESEAVFPVNPSVLGEVFSVVVFARPQFPLEGLLWSCCLDLSSLPPSVSHGAVWRVEVATRADRSLVARVWGFEYSSPCGEIVADDAFDESFGDFVSVVVVKTWSELKIRVNQTVWTSTHTCNTSSPTDSSGGHGSLSVAGRQEGSAGYRGSLACLMITAQDVETIDEGELLSLCQTNSTTINSSDVCDVKAALQDRRFRLYAENAQPQAVMSLEPLTSLTTSSVAQCASRCLQTEHCRSFTIDKQSAPRWCLLYDFVTLASPVQAFGKNYYVMISNSD